MAALFAIELAQLHYRSLSKEMGNNLFIYFKTIKDFLLFPTMGSFIDY